MYTHTSNETGAVPPRASWLARTGVGRALAVLAVLTFGSAMAQQGGSAVVSFQDDVATLDPAIGYDWQNWSIIKSIFDGLMDYTPGTTELIPHLAESYTVSEDGRTYVFTLRQGIKFHNGRTMVAGDVKYTLERTLDPATQSPGQGFYLTIEGAQEFIDGAADEVSGIVVIDDSTIQFTTSEPDASFLHKLGLNFAHIVPREAVEAAKGDFGHQPVGTGGFMLKEWVLGQRIVLERNPDYFEAGVPFLDELTFQVGVDQNVAFLRLQRGEVDILGDGIPSARYTEVMADPTWSKQVSIGEQMQTGYVTINVEMEPFTDLRVRQALNMAINKDRIVRIINNRAVPATQILPPLFASHDVNYAGYPYDPAAAKALLADAGFPNGFDTVLYAYNVAPNDRIAQAIQADLAEIGVRAELRTQAQSTVIEAGGAGEAPLLWSGGMAWIADYPDPNNFYWPILACASNIPGGWNWAKYCDESIEARAAQADTLARTDQQAERVEEWRSIFVDIMGDAPWIPIFHELQVSMHSTNVTGPDAIFVDPMHIPVHYEMVRRAE
ncbi:MAG TPA: ABC transporter substrate-binding protein [Trueperaceae bacterium]|nr:ABC transporter substrate-binding protein [Trueperaceae bacterium]